VEVVFLVVCAAARVGITLGRPKHFTANLDLFGRGHAAGVGCNAAVGIVGVTDTATLGVAARGCGFSRTAPLLVRQPGRAVPGRSHRRTLSCRIWDTESGRELITLAAHSDQVRSVTWTPDAKRLFSAGDDGIIQVYAMDIDLLMALARSRVTR